MQIRFIRPKHSTGLALVLSLLMAAPLHLRAEGGNRRSGTADTVTRDIVLTEGGRLAGRVLDGNGKPVASADVHIHFRNRVVATATTRQDGRYGIRGLHTGLHAVQVAGRADIVRLWQKNAAPPSAQTEFVSVAGGRAVRGQYGPAISPFDFLTLGASVAALIVAVEARADVDDLEDLIRQPVSP